MDQPPDRSFTANQPSTPLYGHEVDPNWTYTDKAGHAHYWTEQAFPTLTVVTEHVPCGNPDCFDGDYCSGYDADHYECTRCGERITPATRPATFYQAGRATWQVDGASVTEEQFKAELQAHYELVTQWQAYLKTLSDTEVLSLREGTT